MIPKAVTPAVSRRYITGERVTVARFELKRGGVVPRHVHDNEQVSCVLSGSLRFMFDGGEMTIGPGAIVQIPGGVPHEVEVIEDTIVIDLFSPLRQDWLDRTDSYFQR